MENRETPNERKKRIVKMIRGYRKQGYTYRNIADMMNDANVPTLSGTGQWYHQTVNRASRIDLRTL